MPYKNLNLLIYIYTYFKSGKKSYPILCDMHLVKRRVGSLKSMAIYGRATFSVLQNQPVEQVS